MDTITEMSQTYSRKAIKTTIAGSSIEAVGGAAAVVLAILGLVHVAPDFMLPISAIVIGVALLTQASLFAAGASVFIAREGMGRREKLEFEGGFGAEALAGCAAIVLGILSLAGSHEAVLMAVAAIVLGAGLVLESGATSRVNVLDDARENPAAHRAARRTVAGTEGAQVLVGVAAIVLGILALIGFVPIVLNLVALLAIGVSVLLSGGAVGGKMAVLPEASS